MQQRPSIPALIIWCVVASTPGANAQVPGAIASLEVQVEIASGEQRIPWQAAEIVLVDPGTRTIVRPGTSDQLLLAPPPPGDYPFVCTIHDGMAGRLIVEPASAGE